MRKPRKTLEDDEMLYYLKFSHFDDDIIGKGLMHDKVDKATQFPEMLNKSTQTKGRETSEKGVDTYDELNRIVGDYILHGDKKNINKNDKVVQVNTHKIHSPPSSRSGDEADGEGFISRNARRGFRLAEVVLNTAITTANITMAVSDTIADLVFAPQAEVEEHQQEQQQEIIFVHSSPPETINSLSPPQTVNSSSSSSSSSIASSVPTPTSLPAPTSPQPSTPASSAKTTPRKNSK